MTTRELATLQIAAPSAETGIDLARTLARVDRERHEAFVRYMDACDFRHYTGTELLLPQLRVHRSGVPNQVAPRELWGLYAISVAIADELRAVSRSRVRNSSGHRAPPYNSAVGGGTRSVHRDVALDLVPLDVSAQRFASVCKSLRGSRLSVKGTHTPVAYSRRSQVVVSGMDVQHKDGRTFFTWRGGIGVYPSKGFVHIDARGRAANWRG